MLLSRVSFESSEDVEDEHVVESSILAVVKNKPTETMGAKKGGKTVDDVEDILHVPLKAILLADSFDTKFCPITLERPKVLLPIVNTPMIDYTLAWLESANVVEVLVVCCSHSKQIVDYLDKSKWVNRPEFSVTTIESHYCTSAGEALRLIYQNNLINGDFILISGDTVSNMVLTEALEEHKQRRQKDSKAVMTMVIKQSKPSQITRQTRLGTDALFIAIDSSTKQLLYYNDSLKRSLSLDKTFLAENSSVSSHNDKQDCYIDICSYEVLSLFNENFDYGHLRDLVKGVLGDEVSGCKIYTHEIHSDYAARVDNFRSYDSISKDIIQRWTYPFVPDVQFSTNHPTNRERQGIYRASEISQSCSAEIGPFTYIGKGTSIGDKTVVLNSVIGDGCKIGGGVLIDGCYIWNNVTIEDGCKLKQAILCDGVVMRSGSVLEPGVVLSSNVVVGPKIVVPAYSKVSLQPQPVEQDSDDELEYADDNSETLHTVNTVENGYSSSERELSEIGIGGRGFVWSKSEVDREEEWRHSVAPIPESKLIELTHKVFDEQDSDDESDEEPPTFEKEIEATFLRGVRKKIKEEDILLEINSLRFLYNMASENCASALFYAMMKLALDSPHNSPANLVKNANDVITRWGSLLKPYLRGIDDEIEVIMKFEEMCTENGKEFAPLFVQIMHLLYDKDIIQEEAFLNWANEKEQADESDKVFVKQSETFIQWLNEASEEED
ncbi:hypothetical protein QVD17_19054 [Tagetes erecta]|uniref:Translation initiation factor eIF2B subunit epsilon n=1 Tax=Tagetes erecta TaxID=13708 RepID=A0AAD8KMB0_TARER|nr:hypothetical protein QVD17_19054 [Tagetes erecta]